MAKYHKEWSRAPYNFVPLPEHVYTVNHGLEIGGEAGVKPWTDQGQFLPGTHTGFFDLEIVTETPTYVRCGPSADLVAAEEPKDAAEAFRTERHRQDFFHHGDPEWPVIPGSTLRGMTRALVEILAAGKMQWFSDRYLTYRAVAESTGFQKYYHSQFRGDCLQAGYLEKSSEGWAIRPATTIDGYSYALVNYYARPPLTGRHPPEQEYTEADVVPIWLRVKGLGSQTNGPHKISSADHILVREEGITAPGQERNGFVPAVLVRSGDVEGKKWHAAVFARDDNARPIPIRQRMWAQYEADQDLDRGKFFIRRLQEGDPLFYLIADGKLVFFGHTRMFRLPFASGEEPDRTIGRMVPLKLRRPEDIDLAEAIFGRVEPPHTFRGRVSFTDARWDGAGGLPFLASGDQGLRSPKILATPKPEAFQHYLEQDLEASGGRLRHWDDSPDHTQIRGHKRYWHRPGTDPFEASLQFDKQHTVIRPVRNGVRFHGKVYFENLSDLELGALLTALQLPDSKRHHLGMGKPLGMGSVRIQATLHLIDPATRYASLYDGAGHLQTGELATDEVAHRADKARTTFTQAMVDHHSQIAKGTGGAPVRTLWEIPRVAELARLLEWEAALPPAETDYLPAPNSESDTGPFWKDRPVLPRPLQVGRRPERRQPKGDGTDPEGRTDHPRPSQRQDRNRQVQQRLYRPGDTVVCSINQDPQGRWGGRTETGLPVQVLGPLPDGLKSGAKVEMVVVHNKLTYLEVKIRGE